MKRYLMLISTLFLAMAINSYSVAAESIEKHHQEMNKESSGLSGRIENGIRVIGIKASKHEFEPDRIVVKLGEKLRLVVTSVDANHQLAIAEFNVNLIVPVGETKSIEFVADKKGTFQSHCSFYYGDKPAYYFMHTNLMIK